MRRRLPFPVICAALLALSLSGCDRVKRVRECRVFVRLVNGHVDKIQALSKKGNPEEYRVASAAYGLLAKDVRAVTNFTPTGQAIKEEYAATLDSIAPAVAMYATTLESGDGRRIEEARRSLERLRRMEQAVAKRLENHCDGS